MIFLVLCSCAHKTRKDQNSLRAFFAKGQYEQALNFLDESSLKKDDKNKLLYLMERGVVLYSQENFYQAAKTFNQANVLVDKLYTKSIREKLASSVLNDNSETFYGSIIERSMLYYYQAMSFYQLAEKGSYQKLKKDKKGEKELQTIKLTDREIQKNYDRVRTSLVAWDSFFQDLRRTFKEKTLLTQDLVSKILAAELHERLASKRDLEISNQLYKDGLNILTKFGPAYKVFNKKFKEYNFQLIEFRKKKKNHLKITKKHKELTDQYLKTSEYLKYKILKYDKLYRKYNYRKQVKKLKPSKNTLAELKKVDKSTSSFLLELGQIQELKGHNYSLNLRSAISNIENPTSRAMVEGIGVPVLTYFAAGPLGLGFVSHHGNVSMYSQHNAGTELVKEVGIEFEMAKVSEPKMYDALSLEFYNKEELVSSCDLDIIAPLSDLAFINAEERVEHNFVSRSTRVGVKYALAIAAAYGTYKKIQDTSGELFAKPAAITQFLISQKGILASESADTRHWTNIPSQVLSCESNLKAGRYDVRLVQKGKGKDQVPGRKLGSIIVDQAKKSLYSFRHL